MSEPKTRILLVDDHEVVRRGVRALVEAHERFEICGEAGDGRTAIGFAGELQPDVVIIDIGMPELNGHDATRQILQAAPRVQVLVLSMHESEQLVREILADGARGYVLKSDAGRELIAALDALREGKPFFTSRIGEQAFRNHQHESGVKRLARKTSNELTPREREILQLLAEGNSNKKVARRLKISVKTAETHRARVMRKLGIKSVADLVRYAIRNRVIDP